MDIERVVCDSRGTLQANVSGRELSQGSFKKPVLAAHYLRHSLAESAAMIKDGDFSRLEIASGLINKAIALKKENTETRKIVEKAIENYAKDIKLTKLFVPKDKLEILQEINKQLKTIDKHFDQGLSR